MGAFSLIVVINLLNRVMESPVNSRVITQDPLKVTPDEMDPLSYLNRNAFTSEKFKIEIRNLPRLYGYKDVQCLLSTCGVVSKKIKMFRDIVYVTFSCEEEREQAVNLLDERSYRGTNLKVKRSKPAEDPFLKQQLKKRGADCNGDGATAKNIKLESTDPIEQMCASVTPLSTMPYEKQLQKKSNNLKNALQSFERELRKAAPDACKTWVDEKKRLFNLCCNFLPVIPSPTTKGYRNKCEFSIGTDPFGQKKTVGFRLSSYKSGEIAVVEPKCHIVSEGMQAIVHTFQTLIRESQLEQYCVVTHTGHWRGLTVRSGRNESNMMLIVHFSPQSISDEVLNGEKERVHAAMTSKHSNITSFYWNCVNSISSNSSEIEQLELLGGGDSKISEKVLSSTFRLSPTAFFQVNTLATELLYSLVCDWAGTSSDSTVMDVCCGTGTVGIILAKSVRKVIGIEMSQDAIQDAKENAAMNNLSNIQYHCGKAEEILPLLAETLVKVPNVSAVVDPPRSGLHKIVIQSLRKCSFLTKLVYVSCNANAAITNWVDLCRPMSKKFAGAPFQMVKAQPVDLFPHTNHCELVVLFERPSQVDNGVNKAAVSSSASKANVQPTQNLTEAVAVENSEKTSDVNFESTEFNADISSVDTKSAPISEDISQSLDT